MKNNLKFLQNGPLINELAILNMINDCPRVSQNGISKAVSLAPSMVNNYIRKLEEQGFLRKQGATNRDMEYVITEDGDKRRLFLLISYMSEVISLYKLSKSEIEKRFKDIFDQGIKTVLFYGAGETGEVAIHALKSFDVNLLGVVDDNESMIGKDFYGYKVYCCEDIERLLPDAIVITSFTYQDSIYSRLESLKTKGIKVLKI